MYKRQIVLRIIQDLEKILSWFMQQTEYLFRGSSLVIAYKTENSFNLPQQNSQMNYSPNQPYQQPIYPPNFNIQNPTISFQNQFHNPMAMPPYPGDTPMN